MWLDVVVDDTEALLALLNTTPLIDGVEQDLLGPDWALAHGGLGSPAEFARLRAVRAQLQAVVRGGGVDELADQLTGVHQVPHLDASGVTWELVAAPDDLLPVRVVLEWARVQRDQPGRLRPCGNDECQLFLLDRSRANRARWCSMNACGNRLKARRHYERATAPHTP